MLGVYGSGQSQVAIHDHRNLAYYAVAALQRLEDEAPGRLDAPDDLDHDIDVGVVDHRLGVGGENAGRQYDRAFPGQAVHRHGAEREADAGASLDVVAVAQDQLGQRRSNVAAAQQPDPDLSWLHGR